MASLMAIRRTRSAIFTLSSLKVRSSHSSHPIFGHNSQTLTLAPFTSTFSLINLPFKTLTTVTSVGVQNEGFAPEIPQASGDRRNPNEWPPENYPQNGTQTSPDQWKNYPPLGNSNQWENRNQGYPKNENPNFGRGFYGFGHPQSGNPNIGPNYSQMPNSSGSPPGSVDFNDLYSLCQEGRVNEAIELMEDQGLCCDALRFSALFESCGKSAKLEDAKNVYKSCEKSEKLEGAKKLYDYFLKSTLRDDLELNHKAIEMFSKFGSMVDGRRVFDHMEIGIWILGI